MKKRILALASVLALVAVLVAPMAVSADNTGTQEASTSQATSITVVSKSGTDNVSVSTITFPAGAPSAVISNPSNNIDGTTAGGITTGPQVLSGTVSEPVVQFKNTSAGTLTIWLGISSWTGAVASERYKLVDTATTTVESLSGEAALGASATTSTAITAGTYKALYLEVTLGTQYGKSGTSTLTVLGES